MYVCGHVFCTFDEKAATLSLPPSSNLQGGGALRTLHARARMSIILKKKEEALDLEEEEEEHICTSPRHLSIMFDILNKNNNEKHAFFAGIVCSTRC